MALLNLVRFIFLFFYAELIDCTVLTLPVQKSLQTDKEKENQEEARIWGRESAVLVAEYARNDPDLVKDYAPVFRDRHPIARE